MPASLPTTLQKLKLVSAANRVILLEFYEYLRFKEYKSEHHITSLLTLLISFDKFYNSAIPFTSINTKEQILTFLDHQYVAAEGRWVKREHDPEGRYISSFNFYLGLLRIFFRWLFNRGRSEDDWETPPFLKTKTKKPLRESVWY